MTPKQLFARLHHVEREERLKEARMLVVMATASRGEGSDIDAKLQELLKDYER